MPAFERQSPASECIIRDAKNIATSAKSARGAPNAVLPSCSILCFFPSLLAALGLCCSGCVRQAKPIAINASVTIVESAQEPGPIHRATEDLRHDFAKVFGQQPKLVIESERRGPGHDPHRAKSKRAGRSWTALRPAARRHSHFRLPAPARQARRLPHRHGHARHHLRHLRVFAAHPRRGPNVFVDGQAAREARVHRAARGFRSRLSQPRLQISRLFHQRRRLAERMDPCQQKAIKQESRSRPGTWSSRRLCA